jgi:hypothetical protein
MPQLSDRQWQVLECIKDLCTNREIRERLGMTPQVLSNIRRKLVEAGVITAVGDLPAGAGSRNGYPWVVHEPWDRALPAGARLRMDYPAEHQRDLTVPGVTHITWGPWSVQSAIMLRDDGRPPKEALPDHRTLVVTDTLSDRRWCGVVPIGTPWREIDTLGLLARGTVRVTDSNRQAITKAIAAALGVEAVLDLTYTQPE